MTSTVYSLDLHVYPGPAAVRLASEQKLTSGHINAPGFLFLKIVLHIVLHFQVNFMVSLPISTPPKFLLRSLQDFTDFKALQGEGQS